MRREVRLWLTSAEDIYDAQAFLQNSRYFRTAFFSQQAVEKALKSLLTTKKRSPPKFHSVTELYRNLKGSGFSLPEELEKHLFILNKYYTISRYPDAPNGLPSDSVDEVEAKRALDLAKGVVEYAREVATRSDPQS